tara:strand:- start:1642 stop:2031 length:390 start_codon:yes stop_codon:yes gene_type:complete
MGGLGGTNVRSLSSNNQDRAPLRTQAVNFKTLTGIQNPNDRRSSLSSQAQAIASVVNSQLSLPSVNRPNQIPSRRVSANTLLSSNRSTNPQSQIASSQLPRRPEALGQRRQVNQSGSNGQNYSWRLRRS